MYSQNDWNDINAMLKKRWTFTAIPTAALLLAAGIVFVYGRINRSDTIWMLTSALTLLGGGYFLFFYGVYVRPARIYRKHLNYMLHGRMRETTGVLKFISEEVKDREGLECRLDEGDEGREARVRRGQVQGREDHRRQEGPRHQPVDKGC